ncbi:unnamed protein product [Urochloa humidicola]
MRPGGCSSAAARRGSAVCVRGAAAVHGRRARRAAARLWPDPRGRSLQHPAGVPGWCWVGPGSPSSTLPPQVLGRGTAAGEPREWCSSTAQKSEGSDRGAAPAPGNCVAGKELDLGGEARLGPAVGTSNDDLQEDAVAALPIFLFARAGS